MTIRMAIIGAGTIGSVHAESIAENTRSELVAVCDVDLAAATHLAGPLGASAVTSVDEVVGHAPDAVIIASSTASHGDVARACIEAGRPFLCEKPLAFDLQTAKAIVAEAEEHGVTAAMAFNRRFDHQYAAIKDAIESGEIGHPEALNIVSRTAKTPTPDFIRTSGGLFAEKGSHFYDLARWICREDPVEVFAMGSVLVDPGFADVGEVDTAKILLRMPSGTLCQCDFSWRAAYGQDERLEVNGAKGMLSTLQAPVGSMVSQTAAGLTHPGKLPGWQERFRQTYCDELDAFLDLLTGDAPAASLPTLADGVAAQHIAESARRSLAENRPVAL